MDFHFHFLQILPNCVFSSRLWTKFYTISYLMCAAFTVHSRRLLSSCNNCTDHLILITEHFCPRKYFRVRYRLVRIKWQYRYRLFLRFLRFSSLNPCELRGVLLVLPNPFVCFIRRLDCEMHTGFAA